MEILILVALLIAFLIHRQRASSADDQPKRRRSRHVLGPVMLGESLHQVGRAPPARVPYLSRASADPMVAEQSVDDEDDDYLFGQVCVTPVSFGYPCNQQLDPYDMDPTNPLSLNYQDATEVGFEEISQSEEFSEDPFAN